MKIAKYVGIAFLVLIVGFVILVALQPSKFHIERTAVVNAPADAVFPLINNFQEWSKWSPYEKLDPNLQRTFTGPESGPGASYAWSGNDQAGAGMMTIMESKPNELVSIKLEFSKPFEMVSQATFTLVPSGETTRVTWAMDGENNFVCKAFSLFMNMDQMVGKDFEVGLANLNTAAQAEVKKSDTKESDTKESDKPADMKEKNRE